MEVVRRGSQHISERGETRNLSSGGVLFRTEAAIDIGEPIEYFINLPTADGAGEVRLRCRGKIVRREEAQGSLAATLERYEFIRKGSASSSR